jgi:hypothetical protein
VTVKQNPTERRESEDETTNNCRNKREINIAEISGLGTGRKMENTGYMLTD